MNMTTTMTKIPFTIFNYISCKETIMGWFNDLMYNYGPRTQTDWRRENAIERGDTNRETVEEQRRLEKEQRKEHMRKNGNGIP